MDDRRRDCSHRHCGLVFKEQIKGPLRQIQWIAIAAIGFAIVLLIAELSVAAHPGRRCRPGNGDDWLARSTLHRNLSGLCVDSGRFRSGVTITAGLFTGLSRSASRPVLVLLSLPSVFAAGVYEFWKDRHEILSSQDDAVALAVAAVVSGIVGYASIAFLLGFLKRYSTWVFIVYRVILGSLLLALLGAGIVHG
jgi:undecaprenyl-diphosphatase